jgi:hypothetical protein
MDMKSSKTVVATFLALGIAVAPVGAAVAQGAQGGMDQMGPGATQGGAGSGMTQGGAAQTGPGATQGGAGSGTMQGGMGQMRPGMMHGGMGPGMMQGGMGPGMMQGGMGPGMMKGGMAPGASPLFGARVMPVMHLSVEDVRSYLDLQLERLNNKRLKVGDVKAVGGAIIADIVTVDNSLVQRLKVDPRTGAIEYEK